MGCESRETQWLINKLGVGGMLGEGRLTSHHSLIYGNPFIYVFWGTWGMFQGSLGIFLGTMRGYGLT